MKSFLFVSMAGALVTLSGCQTYRPQSRSRSQATYTQPQYKTESTAGSKLQLEAVRKEFDGVYEQVGALTTRLNEMSQSQATLAGNVNSLEHKLAASSQENQRLRSEVTTLRNELASQNKQVRGMIDGVVDQVAKDTASALNSMQASSNQGTSSGDYYEYKVQAGATLGAIAKAYKCSIKEIKAANSLKSDRIFVGQKLKIPKK